MQSKNMLFQQFFLTFQGIHRFSLEMDIFPSFPGSVSAMFTYFWDTGYKCILTASLNKGPLSSSVLDFKGLKIK